jgi:hypothetical protein
MPPDVPILLVEDDQLDVRNVHRAFERVKITNPLYVVSNGEEALAFLRREGPFDDPATAPRPGLILLDLNMPVMGGLEFLDIYRNDKKLQSIPSVVLTTSDEERDLIQAYAKGVAGYIVKPVSFAKFVDAVSTLNLYWTVCELP